MVHSDRYLNRPAVARYRAYCDELNIKLRNYELPKTLHIEFNLPMPHSWSQAKRLLKNETMHDSKPDLDNLVKAFMDAFHSEDKHVSGIVASKFWAESGAIIVCLDHDPERLYCNSLDPTTSLLSNK